jgi:CRISPR-associated protein Cas1
MEIVVTEFGVSLGKKSERVQIRRNGAVIEEHPLFQVSHIIIGSNGVAISSDLVRECAAAGIPISFLSGSGKPLARLSSPEMTGSVETRRQQMMAYLDRRGVAFALAIARAKIANQAVILKYFGKSRKAAHPELYSLLRNAAKQIARAAQELDRLEARFSESPSEATINNWSHNSDFYEHETGVQIEASAPDVITCIDDARLSILAVEGRASRTYWDAIRQLLPDKLGFTGRTHRGATDLVNCLLNYGYGILYQQVWGAATLAGLDPFAGFLHVDRPGKPSLVLDLVEEFRQMVVDRTVFGLLNKGVIYDLTPEGRLVDEARRQFAQRIFDRLDAQVRYEGRRELLRAVIQKQARHLACFFRREREYKGFVGSW